MAGGWRRRAAAPPPPAPAAPRPSRRQPAPCAPLLPPQVGKRVWRVENTLGPHNIVTVTDPEDPEGAEVPAITAVLALLEELGGSSDQAISGWRRAGGGRRGWRGLAARLGRGPAGLLGWRRAGAPPARLVAGVAALGQRRPRTGAEPDRSLRCRARAGEMVSGLAVAVASDPLKPASELSSEDYQLVGLEVRRARGQGVVRGSLLLALPACCLPPGSCGSWCRGSRAAEQPPAPPPLPPPRALHLAAPHPHPLPPAPHPTSHPRRAPAQGLDESYGVISLAGEVRTGCRLQLVVRDDAGVRADLADKLLAYKRRDLQVGRAWWGVGLLLTLTLGMAAGRAARAAAAAQDTVR
jgi:hypothetical protein